MPRDFTVTALISAFNEADVIAEVIEHLVAQHVNVYFIDDGSTDGTASIVERYVGRGVVGIERRPPSDGIGSFSWTEILTRKETLATEIESTWFLHHDADELRESPTQALDLRAAIQAVDHLGYNAVTFKLLDFPPTDNAFGPGSTLREHFRFYEPGRAFDQVQVKGWRKGADRVDLTSSGGHEARFPGRRICPIPFITRHYPIRSQVHGEQKVFRERQQRFSAAERANRWHVQYDTLTQGHSFVRDPGTLIPFDLDRVREELVFALPGEDALPGEELRAARPRDEQRRLEKHLAERQRAMEQLEAALRRERDETERQKANAQAARQAMQNAESQMRTAQDSARWAEQAAREELRAVFESRSWRITRPLRAVNTMLTGAPTSSGDVRPGVAGRTGFDEPHRRIAPVRWGDLGRTVPFSQTWGFDRGLPIDRHYIRLFLEQHAADIRGRVLEVKDANYSKMFGADRVASVDVIDIDAANPNATIVADLANASTVDGNRFDCFILTQTVHVIFNVGSAIREAARLLAADGVLLCTIPAVSRVNDEDGGLEGGDYWRMTRAAVMRLFADAFRSEDLHVATFGNVQTCAAFLYGLAAEELDPRDLTIHDPWFPLIHCVRAVKRR